MAQQPTAPATAPIDEAQVDTTAAAFAANWASRATSEELGELLASHLTIPAALDAELLRAVQARHGDLRSRGDLRRATRAGSGPNCTMQGPNPAHPSRSDTRPSAFSLMSARRLPARGTRTPGGPPTAV
jgi:hypothetical protein